MNDPTPCRSARSQRRLRPPVLLAAALALVAAAAVIAPRVTAQEPAGDEEEAEPAGPLVAEGPDPDLIFIATGRVRGFVEPCGCPRHPAGGLARRAGYLGLLEAEYPKAHIVLVDTGEFAAEFDEAGRLKTSTYVEGLTRFGYDAVGVGERELAGGLDAWKEILGDSGLPLVSASFAFRGTTDTLVPPYVVKEYKLRKGKSLRVGFLGLTSQNSRFASLAADGRAVIARDPLEQARAFLPALAREADLVVLLANLGAGEIRRVVEAFPGVVDLALGAFSDRLSPGKLEEIAGVPVLYSGDQGRRLGEVRVFLGEEGVERMTGHHVHLTDRYPAEIRYQRMIDGMLAKVNEINRKVALAGGLPAHAPAPSPGSPAGSPVAPSARFVGAGACRLCHDEDFRIWEHSAHAEAMSTLVKANQDYNPECIGCHTTGFGAQTGFVSANSTPGLANVQCESCHGAGSAHSESQGAAYGQVPPRACFSCHTRENSPDFSFFKYWDLIKH